MRSSSGLKPRYPLGITLMVLDHIVESQDVRGLESLDIPIIPSLDLELRRDSAPAARRPCKDIVTTYLLSTLIHVLV